MDFNRRFVMIGCKMGAVGSGGVAIPFEFGNALLFDGADDYVNTATNTFSSLFYNANGQYTISFWVKPNIISNYPVLFSSSITTGNLFLELGNNTNTLYWGAASGFRTYSAVGFSVNTWNHFTITKTGLGNNGDIYLNGTLLSNYTGSILDIANINLSLLIGKYVSGSLNYNGVMDETAIWNGVSATAQNAIDLYNSGNGALASSIIPNPTAYWRFNESGSDTTATDSSGSGNDGTLNNFPTNGMWVDHTSTPFKMTIDTTQAGSASDTFVLPFTSTGNYNCVVNWGDSTSSTITAYNDAALTHVYSASGTYQISINHYFGGINFANGGDKLKLTSIDQWGTNVFASMASAFHGCANMTGNFTDYPNLGTISNLSNTFRGCTLFNGDISSWDVSSVTVFNTMFYQATNFNSNIDSWTLKSTGNITMNNMFQFCTNFNQPLNSWNISRVVSFYETFANCPSFNQNLNSWDVSNVATMYRMFLSCTNFGLSGIGGDISSWTPTSCTVMERMLQSATNFNSDISGWDVSSVTNMKVMLYATTAFDQNIGSWNVSNVTIFNDFMGLQTPSTFSAANLDAIYNGWDSRAVQTPITITFGSAKHTSASSAARASLISKGWTITDGGI